jgi:hypothetical protein
VAENLTSLANAKAWLGLTTDATDPMIIRLIAGSSRAILGKINRPSVISRTYTEKYSGTGNQRFMLRNWPVTAVQSLSIDGVAAVACTTPPLGAGFQFDAWDGYCPGGMSMIGINSSFFTRGFQNVLVTYTAGYLIANEAAVIPATPFQVTALAPQGIFAADVGVTKAGAAMTAVATSPATGQYSVSAAGVYTFAAADTGSAVLISYSFIPADLEMACFELVGEAYRYRDHIGQASKSLGGQETVSYTRAIMSDYVQGLLQPYTSVIPV